MLMCIIISVIKDSQIPTTKNEDHKPGSETPVMWVSMTNGNETSCYLF